MGADIYRHPWAVGPLRWIVVTMHAGMRLELNVEAMKHTIVQHISEHQAGIEEEVDAAIRKAMASFSLTDQVERVVARHMQDGIEQLVSRTISDLFSDEQVRTAMRSAIVKRLVESA